MSTTVYPTSGQTCQSAAGAPGNTHNFDPLVPSHIITLTGAAEIERRDSAVVVALIGYKSRDSTLVWPSQATLARRLACCVDTIQRSLKRLVQAGMIVKQYQRDAKGRLRGLVYDLAPLLAWLSTKAARLQPGAAGKNSKGGRPVPSETGAKTPPAPKPHASGPEAREEFVKEANTDPATAALVQEMRAVGVFVASAHALVTEFGADACRRQLTALPLRKNLRDKAATLVASIKGHWTVPGAAPDTVRAARHVPRPVAPYREPPPLAPVPPDPLDALAPDVRASLETRAFRAICQAMPPFRKMLESGRGGQLVRERMRMLLAEADAQAQIRPGA